MSCGEDSTVRVWRGQCACTVCVRIVCRISFRIFIKRGKRDICRVRGARAIVTLPSILYRIFSLARDIIVLVNYKGSGGMLH